MSGFKSGGTGVTNSAQQWKERADELAEQLLELTAEKDELQSRLDEIAQIAAPDNEERLERIEFEHEALGLAQRKTNAMLQKLLAHAGLEEVQEQTVSEEEGLHNRKTGAVYRVPPGE